MNWKRWICAVLLLLPAAPLTVQAAQSQEESWTLNDYFAWSSNDLALQWLDETPEAARSGREELSMALDYMETACQLRAHQGREELLISDLQMMQALIHAAENSSPLIEHQPPFWLEANLSWGQIPGAPMNPDAGPAQIAGIQNPFDAWFTCDRLLMEQADPMPGAGQSYGRLMDETIRISGFGLMESRDGYGMVFAQTFSQQTRAGEQAVTVEEYRRRLKRFEADYAAGITKDDSQALFRLYNPNSGEHFFTVSEKEAFSLQNAGWKDEHIAWQSADDTLLPVFRLYNPGAGDHHCTLDARERDVLTDYGWKDEGISFYACPEGRPVFRLYNPNAKAGAHHFTLSEQEYEAPGQAG